MLPALCTQSFEKFKLLLGVESVPYWRDFWHQRQAGVWRLRGILRRAGPPIFLNDTSGSHTLHYSCHSGAEQE